MKKNIIFDFGNVLVQWHPERVYAEHFGSEALAAHFLEHVFTADWRSRIDAGERQDLCLEQLKAEHPGYDEAFDLYRDRWADMLTGEVPGMRALLADLREASELEIFGLTNWSMETFPQSRQMFPILGQIDRYVVSGAEGLVKPDPRLFQRLLDRYGLSAEECIFVDDNPANVRAASGMGMEAMRFTSADDLRQRLNLYRTLTPDEIEQLERQHNDCYNWLRVRVAPTADLSQISHNRFKHDITLGHNVKINYSHLCDCTVSDNCEVDNCRHIENMHLRRDCRLLNVGEVSFNPQGVQLAVMNENGSRPVSPFEGMTVADAFLMARFRDRAQLQTRLAAFDPARTGVIGEGTTIRNATAVIDGMIGPGCEIGHGVIAERFALGENVHLEAGLRLNDSVVGDNSTLARGEVGNALIFPAHEQHHNNSFLIAALVQGQSNVAAGATLGSNHNGRTADGEFSAGRGFWPGLCVSLKHNCRFASYTLLAKGDYPAELNITLPFALVNNNVSKNRLEVMPAYWWLYNMYALNRNRTKFAARDRRSLRRQHIEFSPFAPDSAEEIILGRELLHLWTTRAYQEQKQSAPNSQFTVLAYGMERGHRPTVILKPADGYRAYEEMLIYYAMSELENSKFDISAFSGEGRERRWFNLGGQLIAGADMDRLLDDIERGVLNSWDDVHRRLDDLWAAYPEQRARHAYGVLCHLAQKKALDDADWQHFRTRYAQIQQLVRDRIAASHQKDADNEFRQTTFLNTAEMKAVLGE